MVEIRHKFTGAVILIVEGADLKGADLKGAYLKGANLRGANLEDANLTDANLTGAVLTCADLKGVHLKGAYLKGAYLEDANLEGADLKGADLKGAYLKGTCLVDCGQRSDGYQFHIHQKDKGEPIVIAGCRHMRVSSAVDHWRKTRGETKLGLESQALIAHGLRLIEIRNKLE